MAHKEDEGAVSEDELEKALNDLEEQVSLRKGDDLQNQDTEGGFSTEGQKLSAMAKGTKGKKVAKGDDASSMSPDQKSMKKARKAADENSSSDGSSDVDPDGDESDEESDSISKGFQENSTVRQGVEISDFLEGFTQENVGALEALAKAIDDIGETSSNRIAKGFAEAKAFDLKLARGIIMIGRQQAELMDLVKSIADQEAPQERRPARQQNSEPLRKSQIVEPRRQQSGPTVSRKKVQDWLIKKAMEPNSGILPEHVSFGEVNGFDIDAMRTVDKEGICKAIEADILGVQDDE